MSTRCAALVAVVIILVSTPAGAQSAEAEGFWGQWRGPHATGVAPHGDPPAEWSETRNIAWKVAIPGRGSASDNRTD